MCVKASLTGSAKGLCNAYCELGDLAKASPSACTKVKANFQKVVGDPNASLPCERACPCAADWTAEVLASYPIKVTGVCDGQNVIGSRRTSAIGSELGIGLNITFTEFEKVCSTKTLSGTNSRAVHTLEEAQACYNALQLGVTCPAN